MKKRGNRLLLNLRIHHYDNFDSREKSSKIKFLWHPSANSLHFNATPFALRTVKITRRIIRRKVHTHQKKKKNTQKSDIKENICKDDEFRTRNERITRRTWGGISSRLSANLREVWVQGLTNPLISKKAQRRGCVWSRKRRFVESILEKYPFASAPKEFN